MQIESYPRKVWKKILDLFFPVSYDQTFINNLSVEEFLSLAKPAIDSHLPNTLAILCYRDKLVKTAIWSLKFGNNQVISRLFAEIIYERLIEELSELNLSCNFNAPLLLTVPLHKKKQRARGYNQVDLIAQEISKLDQNNFLEYRKDILKKIKETPAQSHAKNKSDRLKNLKDCFKVIHPDSIRNRNIILLDDVTTTGATLIEAVETLKTAQPKNIICVTLAH